MLKPIATRFFARVAERRSADTGPCRGSTAGTSFVEVLIAVAVFVTGMVPIMGGVMTLTTHRRVADERAQATSFAGSAFENIRGLGIDAILAYDLPVDNQATNTIDLPGTGPVTVSLFAVIPGADGGAPTYFELGVGDVSGINVASLPNPIEIRAEISPYHESDDQYAQMQFNTATMIDY